MGWIVGILAGIFIGYLIDREIYFYEGVHFGALAPRAQAWLYDRWALKYDAGKRESQLHDVEMLARPLLEMVKDVPEPFLLDFAAGTGRLSFALLSQPDFKGHIVALDLSLGMLEQAVKKIAGRVAEGISRPEARIEFLRHPSLPLPFPDGTFDAVCALEVLEHFPSMDGPLKELTRVLRPGGVLLTSRGTEASGRRAMVKSREDFTSLLERCGLGHIQIMPWWKLYDRVLAVKGGASDPAGRNTLVQVLHCRACGQADWLDEPGKWTCRICGEALIVTEDGIVLN